MTKAASPVRYQAVVQRPATPKSANWLFVRVPAEASAKLPTRSMISVEGAINGQDYQATLEPDGQGSHWLKLPRDLQQSANINAGDVASISMTPMAQQLEPVLPGDLRQALDANPAARSKWNDITTTARRDFIAWIESAKKPETRDRRVNSVADRLLSGKRAICCFDRSGRFGNNFCAPEALD